MTLPAIGCLAKSPVLGPHSLLLNRPEVQLDAVDYAQYKSAAAALLGCLAGLVIVVVHWLYSG